MQIYLRLFRVSLLWKNKSWCQYRRYLEFNEGKACLYVEDMAPEIIDPIFTKRQVAMDKAKNLKEQKKLKSSGASQQ